MTAHLTDILADRAYEQVMTSIKVVGSAPCPVKGHVYICGCERAMSCMNAADHIRTKRVYYCMLFENMLLERDHAWTYTGNTSSHDIFTSTEGLTPKDFVRQVLQEHPVISKFFAPSGRLQDTVQASLSLWTARNQQWREKHGEREVAKERWSEDAYPDMPQSRTRRLSDLPAGVDYKAGTVYMEHEPTPVEVLQGGQGEHWFQVTVSKEDPRDKEGRTPFGVTVEELELCHPDCKIGMKLFQDALEEVAKIALPKLEARAGEVPPVLERDNRLPGGSTSTEE